MADEYTPTTDTMKRAWALWRRPFLRRRWVYGMEQEISDAEFDRWLASVKAEAWDEAVDALDRHYGDLSGLDRIVQDLDDLNPYREETTNE